MIENVVAIVLYNKQSEEINLRVTDIKTAP